MKIGILLMGSGGRPDVVPGTIIEVRQFRDNEPVVWGARCVPPKFWTVVLSGVTTADLPVDYRTGAYGWLKSRKRLDATRLQDGKARLLDTQPTVGMSLVELRMACVDNGEDWRPEIG